MRVIATAGTVLAMVCAAAWAQVQPPETFTPAQIKVGSGIYAQNCAPCHGPQMKDPEAAFDLRKMTADQKERFVTSVVKGKNQMPPWGDVFKTEEIDALWAYVMAGEK
jgi:mono/diheme cytochrome c family protein